jgi:hypothetical protein
VPSAPEEAPTDPGEVDVSGADAEPGTESAAPAPAAVVADPEPVADPDPAAVVADADPDVAAASTAVVEDLPPSPSMDSSWLPGGLNDGVANPGDPIVPGSAVDLALQQIAETQGIIRQATWGSGNIAAGLVALVPQIFLAGATLSMFAWQTANPAAQGLLAATAGIPIVAQVAQVSLLTTMVLPSVAEFSMDAAAFLLPVVGLFGADVAPAQGTLAQARQNGKVYAVVPVRVKAQTQPTISISVNGAGRIPVLIDTGASGLIVTPDRVGNLDELTPVGPVRTSCFSGGLCYDYQSYDGAVVDFGAGAVTSPTVINVVEPGSVAEFNQFLAWGANGILGVGANRDAGPGPAPIPTAVLPGELSDGFLLFQNFLPFGLLGFMVFGPNPLPVRASVPGTPDSYVVVSIPGGTPSIAPAIIDSGGVGGTVRAENAPAGSPAGSVLPAGTRISVYAADGTTLLYTYFTQPGTPSNPGYGTPVIADGFMNSGNGPFAQGPIYLNYGYDDSYGIGSTDFAIW